jgi:hypothetical protein
VRRNLSVDTLPSRSFRKKSFLIFFLWGVVGDLLSKCSHREQHAGGFCTWGEKINFVYFRWDG